MCTAAHNWPDFSHSTIVEKKNSALMGSAQATACPLWSAIALQQYRQAAPPAASAAAAAVPAAALALLGSLLAAWACVLQAACAVLPLHTAEACANQDSNSCVKRLKQRIHVA
jgi:hypothetical protein